ncbi:MAG: antitoxin [Sulfolobus sp.]|nr:antitoxin [Sulfolobus sp.]
MTTEVISIRVSKRLKEEIEELGIDYAALIREYLEEVVKREKRKILLKESDKIREELKNKYGEIDLTKFIREDRDEINR